MRIFSENEVLQLSNYAYKEAQKTGAIGRFKVKMTKKQAAMMDSRRLSLEIEQRIRWVEDGFHTVIGQIMFSKDSVLPYFASCYPPGFLTENERRTETKEERRTLLYRICNMLANLKSFKDRFEVFEQWRFAGLEFAMQSFDYVVTQAFGVQAHDAFYDFYRRCRQLWRSVAPALDSPEAIEKELDALILKASAVFATLTQCCSIKESQIVHDKSLDKKIDDLSKYVGNASSMMEGAARRVENAVDDMTATATEMRGARRDVRNAVRVVEKVAGTAKPRISAEEDKTSREAGLWRLNASRQAEIRTAIEYSHKCFPVSRDKKADRRSLLALAENVWKLNKDRFTALARLKVDPGYKDEHSFACALYRLAANYPEADHFRWLS